MIAFSGRAGARARARSHRPRQPGRAARAASARSSHGSDLHTDVMKTQALRQALTSTGSMPQSAARAATRRHPAPRSGSSRSATRITAGIRSASARSPGGSTTCASAPAKACACFPLSNWTELDVWLYIYQERIPIVPLYFAAERPVVERDGLIDHGRRRAASARAGTSGRRCGRSASGPSAAIR